MMKNKFFITPLKLIGSLSLFLCIATPSYAEIQINGFGNFIIGKTPGRDSYSGYTEDPTFEPDSIMGLQFSHKFDDKLTATAQVIAKAETNWRADLAWAYLSYEATDNLQLFFGRQRIPFYAYSEFIDVGYTYHWNTPPGQVYSAPLDTVNGFGAVYTHEIGHFTSKWHLTLGEGRNSPTDRFVFDYPDLKNLVWSIEQDNYKFRLNYGTSRQAFENAGFNALAAPFEQQGPAAGLSDDQIQNIVNKIISDYTNNDDDDTIAFLIAGFNYNNGNWLIASEYSQLTFKNSLVPSQDVWYASVGYQFNNITPHFTYGGQDPKIPNTDFLLPAEATGDAILVGTSQAIRAITQSFSNNQRIATVGVRWDFHPSVALKFDITRRWREQSVGSKVSNTLFLFGLSTVF